MRHAKTFIDWFLSIFYLYLSSIILHDLYFSQDRHCSTGSLSLLVFILYPASVIILALSFFKAKDLIKKKAELGIWPKVIYWIKIAVSSTVAISVVAVASIFLFNEFHSPEKSAGGLATESRPSESVANPGQEQAPTPEQVQAPEAGQGQADSNPPVAGQEQAPVQGRTKRPFSRLKLQYDPRVGE